MCHINVIFKKDRKADKKLSRYMNVVSYYSFLANDDGDGYIGMDDDEPIMFDKGFDKFFYSNAYWFLATHQRIATSGKGIGNTHPHETKDFILMHNGIFSSLGSDAKSDSKEFADMLQEAYDAQGDEPRDLTKAIRDLMKKVGGSYSVLIVEKATKRVLYFKERVTNMYKIENQDYLIMSTDEKNVKFARFWLGMKGKIKEVDELYIYDVLNNFKKIRKFEEKPYVYTESKWTSGYGRSSCYGGYDEDYHYTGKVVKSVSYDEDWIKDDRTGIESIDLLCDGESRNKIDRYDFYD